MAQSIGKRDVLFVTLRMDCTSAISRRKYDCFFLRVNSPTSSRSDLGLSVSFPYTSAVNSIGVIPIKIKKPAVIPMQAIKSIVVIRFESPFSSDFL